VGGGGKDKDRCTSTISRFELTDWYADRVAPWRAKFRNDYRGQWQAKKGFGGGDRLDRTTSNRKWD